jgi:hypothetical protein
MNTNKIEKPKKTLKELLIIIGIMILIIAGGLFALNQFLSYYYKSAFLLSPCELCLRENSYLENCFNQESKITTKINLSLEPISYFPES